MLNKSYNTLFYQLLPHFSDVEVTANLGAEDGPSPLESSPPSSDRPPPYSAVASPCSPTLLLDLCPVPSPPTYMDVMRHDIDLNRIYAGRETDVI